MGNKILNFITSSSFGCLVFIFIMSFAVKIGTNDPLVGLVELYFSYFTSTWCFNAAYKDLEDIDNGRTSY